MGSDDEIQREAEDLADTLIEQLTERGYLDGCALDVTPIERALRRRDRLARAAEARSSAEMLFPGSLDRNYLQERAAALEREAEESC